MKELNYAIEYLELLSKDYPTRKAVSAEIINLSAILDLPKGTEHFMSDLHGEYEAFSHVLKNASGVIKEKIDMLYADTISECERKELATLIYYPNRKLYYLRNHDALTKEWYTKTLYRLIELARLVASKYTRSKVRKAMPRNFSYIIEELMHDPESSSSKEEYYAEIIKTVIDIKSADDLIVSLSLMIRRLSVDHLHIIGDIFDRGPRADKIMEELLEHHSVDIQWGNHDIEWIGAASGHEALIANVVRNSLRYNNFDVIEIGYGINTRSLANFAMETYFDDPCERFMPLDSHKHKIRNHDAHLAAKMHKAIAIIQFKLEGQIMKRHAEYKMADRILLEKIDMADKTIEIGGVKYPLADTSFPTIDFNDPLALTEGEEAVIKALRRSFVNSEKLQKHIEFMINKGGMYKIFNGNLLYHGCIPLDEDGALLEVDLFGEKLKGKAYLDFADKYVREAFASKKDKDADKDFLWYLWCGSASPLYGKNSFAVVETYLTNDEKLKKEEKNAYYKFNDKKETSVMILSEFGLSAETGHIMNGHVPVKKGKGESPVKADGLLYVIDGGFSKPYQETTGIAGYTLINNSYGFSITEHQGFTSVADVLENDFDLQSKKILIESYPERRRVKYTDIGERIKKRILVLKDLLYAYEKGLIREK